ncbi:hypothetical protein CHARACLAT_029828 [Characodon lateralis]|uniref:Tc1-like transposase DDE domain-containing protein n=1 Tax=Characodon lateralis TaxID=208331 RepID=A0ABU7DW03_9TELE|nr:hypothetical protein [Characodon lateralis]
MTGTTSGTTGPLTPEAIKAPYPTGGGALENRLSWATQAALGPSELTSSPCEEWAGSAEMGEKHTPARPARCWHKGKQHDFKPLWLSLAGKTHARVFQMDNVPQHTTTMVTERAKIPVNYCEKLEVVNPKHFTNDIHSEMNSLPGLPPYRGGGV